jgi:hypothetical protein
MDWPKNCGNGHSIKSNLYVQCTSHQNPNNNFHTDIKIKPEVHMEAEKTENSQSNPEHKVVILVKDIHCSILLIAL